MADEANNTLSELKNEVKGAVNARLRSPLAGIFALSWMLINHRAIFVLFSDMKVGKRFEFIDDELYPTTGVYLSMNILLPLLSTFFLIFVMPWISEVVNRWNLWHRRRERAIELRSENLKLLTEAEGALLRSAQVSRDRRIDELEQRLSDSLVRLAMFKASHAVVTEQSGDDIATALREYILSGDFGLFHDGVREHTQFHRFRTEGYVDSRIFYFSNGEHPEKWRIEGERLIIISAEKNVFLDLGFNSNVGVFDGYFDSQSVVLRPLSL